MMENHEKDDLSSPLSAQILEFCDPEFLETFQNSEVTSTSNYCYEDNSYYTNNNLSLQLQLQNNNNGNNNSTTTHSTATATTTTSTTTTTAANQDNNINDSNNNNISFSLLFDPQDDLDNEISASIDFSSSPTLPIPQFLTTQQEHFDFLQPQFSLSDMLSAEGLVTQYPADQNNSVAPFIGAPLTSVFEDDCLSSVPSYVPMNPSSPSCSYFRPGINNYLSAGNLNCDNSAFFGGGVFQQQHQDVEFQGDNGGIFCHDSIPPRVFNNPIELQPLGNENQQFVNPAPVASSDISCLEDPAFKVGKLTVEQRREKIHRYMKKRNERNFSKKIKYACRKTLADSRPRVRGRFAKNDEFSETNTRAACSNHEDDDEDEQVVVKQEDQMVDSADIFAHISGVNSFNCNYSIQSWL
ncbi:uncharacterized protein [Euphorbia lathyris]|uniref:uncharacterized protein isoform X2 n=1 Tax=Euphorbia lathyris TaxID=212925 RepID=UPI00331358EC